MNTATLNDLLTEEEKESIPVFLNIDTGRAVESLTVKELFSLFPYISLHKFRHGRVTEKGLLSCFVIEELTERAIKLNINIHS